MAVLNGKYAFPSDGHYSAGLQNLVSMCLVVKPDQRPDIDKVCLDMTPSLVSDEVGEELIVWSGSQVIEATRAAIARLE